jgi:hypothetical protein
MLVRLRQLTTSIIVLSSCASVATGYEFRPGGVPASGAQAVAFLNVQRRANAIPPITTVYQPFASAWCPNEDNGPSGGESGRVLSSFSYFDGSEWGPDHTPWDNFPLHQSVMYYPLATAAGEVNHGLTACMGLGDGLPEPTSPTTYLYLGDEGRVNVPTAIRPEHEGPFAPQQIVGISSTTQTGPQPIFYVFGLGTVHAASWSLTTASGASVSGVKMVDSASAAAAGYSGFQTVAYMVPPPLVGETTYEGHVLWAGASGETLPQSFSFTTAPSYNRLVSWIPEISGVERRHPKQIVVAVETEAPHPTLTLTFEGGARRRSIKPVLHLIRAYQNQPALPDQSGRVREYHSILRLGHGLWVACASSGGPPPGAYEPRSECFSFRVSRNGSFVLGSRHFLRRAP